MILFPVGDSMLSKCLLDETTIRLILLNEFIVIVLGELVTEVDDADEKISFLVSSSVF